MRTYHLLEQNSMAGQAYARGSQSWCVITCLLVESLWIREEVEEGRDRLDLSHLLMMHGREAISAVCALEQ